MQVLNGKMATRQGLLGPDGKGHDTFMLSGLAAAQAHDPSVRSTLNVKVGDTVTVTVTNYDEGPHSFTSPELGINATVAPAKDASKGIPSTTTFKFTASKSGKFRWYCMLPCDDKQKGWAMTPESSSTEDRTGYMAGYVVAA